MIDPVYIPADHAVQYRDCLEEKPLETGQDLLPGIISLLQTVPDLSMPAVALIVESITACIKADLLEERSSK